MKEKNSNSKNRGDEPIWVITYIHMKMSPGNTLCKYIKKPKMSFFFLFFFSEQEGRTGPVCGGWFQWERGGGGERVWEDEYTVITVYTCM
jgi:hypothetical protein